MRMANRVDADQTASREKKKKKTGVDMTLDPYNGAG